MIRWIFPGNLRSGREAVSLSIKHHSVTLVQAGDEFDITMQDNILRWKC